MISILPRRGYVGLQVAPVPETAPPGPGLYVRGVQQGSPADQAGTRIGDRLIAIGNARVEDMATARQLLRRLQSQASLHFAVEREGKTVELTGPIRPLPVEQHAWGSIHLDEVSAQGYRLRAIALVPDVPGPHPTLYYLPGAHWASEEYPFAVNEPVPALLGHLAQQGIASLRVDRFGMGDSEGPPCTEVDFVHELSGYRAGLELLCRAPWCDRERVALWGHSLGAMVAPLLAASLPSALTLRGVLTYGASAIPICEGLVGALQRYGEKQPGVAPTTLARQSELLRLIVEEALTPSEALQRRPDLRAVTPDHFTETSIYRRNVSFYHQLQVQPLVAAWANVNAPVVALHGEHDWICSFDDSLRLAALAPNGTARQVPDADHHLSSNRVTFQRDPTARPPSLTLSAQLASTVSAQLAAWF